MNFQAMKVAGAESNRIDDARSNLSTYQHVHLLFLLPSSVSNQVPFPVYFTGRCCIKGSGDKTDCCWIKFGFSSQ